MVPPGPWSELGPPDLELSSQLWVTEICFGHPQNVGKPNPSCVCVFFFLAFLKVYPEPTTLMEFRAEYGDNADILNLRI